MRILSFITLLFSGLLLNAQANQNEYLEAKRQFTLSNYRDAMGAFQSLTNDKVFGPYASFYYALSAYNQGLHKVAMDMWKQVLSRYSDWDQNNEVYFWLARTSFERGNYADGIRYSSFLSDDVKKSVIESAKQGFDPEALGNAYDADPDNRELAILYFEILSEQPYEVRDHERMMILAEKFDLKLDDVVKDFPKTRKDKYAIALVLPFMFDSLQAPQTVIRNSIIFELYQGMKLAGDSLSDLGVNLEFFPFDTRKLGSKAGEIAGEETLKSADLIVGPLYADPHKVISEFSRENEIPMINPLSSNGSLIGENRYAFLFKPSYETQGRKAGEYAVKTFTKNKNAMILFETVRDRVVAEAYKEVLEADSFNIVYFDEVTRESALQIQYDFTHQYVDVLDSLTQEEIDSIALIPNRYVRSRPLRDERTGRIIRDSKGEDMLEYYEMTYTIPLDTIGHIFAATSNNLLANNIISLADVRGDSIGIVGFDSWLDFKQMSYSQMERLGISLIHSSYFDEPASEPIEDLIRKKFFTEPSEYHKIGFELVMQLGDLFKEHGKHFQRGILTGEYREGYIMDGVQYGSYQDNQVVPVVNIEDLRIKVRNRN